MSGSLARQLPIVALFFVLSPVVNGLVISMLWGWFIVPVFHLPALPLIGAIGLALVVRVIIQPDYTATMEKYKDAAPAEMLGMLGGWLIAQLFILALGWLLHLLM